MKRISLVLTKGCVNSLLVLNEGEENGE